tara:strand:- start:2369 stop:3226 length:858 start_codon:yes stop_codon:yes gene_type:complete
MENYYNLVAGIDEAGRGPLFGPVVACAVMFNKDFDISGITDSKKISKNKREKIYQKIISQDIDYGIGIVSNETIDTINILNATKQAMIISVNNLDNIPRKLLIDGNQLLNTKIEQEAIVKGDQKIAEISAASIIAKVSRDKIVDSYDKVFPMYNLSKHKGYGTKHHVVTLNQYGPTSIHRKTFRPVLEINENSMADYESCDKVQYAMRLIKNGYYIKYFDKAKDLAIIHEDKGLVIYNLFVKNQNYEVESSLINEIKEKDSILKRRLDVIYINSGMVKVIKSFKI